MLVTSIRWKSLFLFCLGLAAGTGFCMKWMESDFWLGQERFTILGLELFYSEEKVTRILGSVDDKVRTILRYHLSFDFAFMAGVFPGIAALCMIPADKLRSSGWKLLLFMLALLQSVAWGFDITENYYLLKWLREGYVGSNFSLFHFLVAAKFLIAFTGAILSIFILVFIKKKS